VALARLHEAGIRTWAFFGPVLPVFSDSEEAVHAMFAALSAVGVSRVLVDTLNLTGAVWGRLLRVLEQNYPDVIAPYRYLQQDRRGYAAALAERVARAAQRHNLPHETAF
jgi:DNA repair photolyase